MRWPCVPPGGDQDLEWVELNNQMAVDMDISQWSVDGVGYTFPEGTTVAGGGYIDPGSISEVRGLPFAWE